MTKKLIIIGTIVFLFVLMILASIKLNNTIRVTSEAIEAETLKFYQLVSAQKYEQALKVIDKVIKMDNKLYGETSFEAAEAYIKKAKLATEIGLYDIAKKNIDKAVKISENESVSSQLKNDIFYILYNYYFATKMYNENLKLIETSNKDSVFASEKPNVENFYGIIYLSMKNDLMAEKYFNNFKSIIEDKKQLLQYYQNMLYVSQDKYDYNKYRYYLNKSEEIVKQYLPYDKNQKLRNFMAKITYYTDFARNDEVLELLNKNFEYYTKNKNSNNEKEFYLIYFNIYKDINNYEKAEEYLTKLEEFQQVYPKNSLLNLDIINKKIDLYKDTQNYKKLKIELKKAIALTEAVKEYVPAIYGEELRKVATSKRDCGEIEESYKLINKALDLYKKNFSEYSYPIYEVNKDYADITLAKGNNEEALEYYQKSLEIINKLKGGVTVDSADIYENIANIYSAQGDKEQAIEYITKAIEIYSKTYGKDSIKTYEKILTKCNIYNNFSEGEKAEKLINNMKKQLADKKVIGYKKDVYEQLQ